MLTLRQRMLNTSNFLIGVELVTTRGTMGEAKSIQTRRLAAALSHYDAIDWVSITDNAGGNPMLSPMALGKNVLYAGKEVLIHLSCKDFNRHGLESEAWQLASEGFENILAISGDYPGDGYRGRAKAVFDIDSVGLMTLLSEMNRGLGRPPGDVEGNSKPLRPTSIFVGGVATNFKRHENEVLPQLLKLEKKLQVGAQFIVAQIGFDARKSHEMKVFLDQRGHSKTPLIGNVFLLSLPTARFFRSQKIPGVVVSDELLAQCERYGQGADRGASFFRELAAKQLAYFRGLGYRGGYLGGVHRIEEIHQILDIADSFAQQDWQLFARQIQYSQPGEFYLYAQDPDTRLADPQQWDPQYAASLQKPRQRTRQVTWGYRFSKLCHDRIFTPGRRLFRWAQKIYRRSSNTQQGPALLRVIEHGSKSVLFGCRDCGDCSLPDIAFLCPESECAKNQRNGPCGGTRDGLCEVDSFPCIWARAYERLKYDGREQELLNHAPVIQDESLRGTSSWANALLGRDHHGPAQHASSQTTDSPATTSNPSLSPEHAANDDQSSDTSSPSTTAPV